MNYVWPAMIIISLVTGTINGRLTETIGAGLSAAENSVNVLLSLAGLMCFWSGILNIAQKGGINKFIEKFFRPITNFLFPNLKKGSKALGKITANMSANLLGMGNAATPAGISAMEELDRLNNHKKTPSDEMCLFTVINTSSIQLLPTTVISLRAAAGAMNPASVIIPVWICSALSLIAAVSAMKIILKFKKEK